MPEEVFRIVVSVAVGLAAIVLVVQAGVILALYKAVRQLQAKVGPILERTGPVIDKMGPIMDRVPPMLAQANNAIAQVGPAIERVTATVAQAQPILQSTQQILVESRPRLVEIAADSAAIVKSARRQVETAGELFQDASVRLKERVAQVDLAVAHTVEQADQVGDAVKRAAMKPIREVNGLAAGFSAAFSTIVHGSRKHSVESATQDEEMFI